MFAADGSGTGQAAALNQDGTVNSPANPAQPGSIVSLFGNGPAPSSQFIASVPAKILYGGQAPGLAPGVTQLNVLLPSNLPAGAASVGLTYSGNIFVSVR